MAYDGLCSFGELLRTFRTRTHLTQQQLARAIGLHRNAISRWEQGEFLPGSRSLVLELARQFHLDDQDTRKLLEASLTAISPPFMVPLPRNPYFTGREEVLSTLHTQLGVDQAVALTQTSALHGLGGVGKTQIALEYAYRHALEYSAVFWIGAETEEQIIASLLHIAEVLQLPECEVNDQHHVVAAVQRWLSTHGQWLLIWDNVEALNVLGHFLPAARPGAILLTTRCQTLGTLAQGLDLAPMEPEEGTLFLLRRAKVLSPEATCEQMHQFATRVPAQYAVASELVTVLGGLPLALDQAGAYLEETHCGLPAYLDLFRTRRDALLQRRGESNHDHPASVSTTFTLAVMAATRRHPAARDLLQFCAFLQPDAIPEELFCQAGQHLGLQAVCSDPLEWDRAVAIACSYSLLSRQPEEQTLSMHRLVQAILLDSMTQTEREHFSKLLIRALDAVFPELEYSIWKQRERLLSHVLLCLHRPGVAEEACSLASLTYKIAHHLHARGRYAEAEPLYQRALSIWEQALGPDHPNTAQTLNHLAICYQMQGKYTQAEPLYQRALSIWEQARHPDAARAINGLATLYAEQGKYTQAELLYQRVCSIWEQALGPDHFHSAPAFNNLAELYLEQGRYQEAEPLYQRALSIWEQALGPDHPDMALPLENLAALYIVQGRYQEAEPLYQRALSIRERVLEPDHPDMAMVLNGLAILNREQGKYAQAEALFLRACSIREQHLGPHHPWTAEILHDLAICYQKQGRVDEMRPLVERTLSIRLQTLGDAHPKTITTQELYSHLVREQAAGGELALEHLRTLLKARGWSLHLKKRHGKPYVYATRKVGKHTQSHYLAPLSNLAACLAAASTLPNPKEE